MKQQRDIVGIVIVVIVVIVAKGICAGPAQPLSCTGCRPIKAFVRAQPLYCTGLMWAVCLLLAWFGRRSAAAAGRRHGLGLDVSALVFRQQAMCYGPCSCDSCVRFA